MGRGSGERPLIVCLLLLGWTRLWTKRVLRRPAVLSVLFLRPSFLHYSFFAARVQVSFLPRAIVLLLSFLRDPIL